MAQDFDDEFELMDSADEAEMAGIAENTAPSGDRKHQRTDSETHDGPPSKMPKVKPSAALGVATNVLNNRFKLPAFRLNQSLAIIRILNGDSAVVVFPTGETYGMRLR